jgi:hypothetical protein
MDKMMGANCVPEDDNRRTEAQALAANKNGEARGEESKIPVHADGNDFGEARRASREDRCQPVGTGGTDIPPPQCQHRKIPVREIIGKIISRVNELEAKHLAYVESHEKRLEQRLNESKVSKEEALQLIEEIREMTRLLEERADEDEE